MAHTPTIRRYYMKFKMLITILLVLIAEQSLACPDGQYRTCIIPRPWGGCAQYACVPKVEDPIAAMTRALNDKATSLAIEGRDSDTIQDRTDCVVIVTAGLATWGTTLGGPWGGLATGISGGAAASLACRKAFPLD